MAGLQRFVAPQDAVIDEVLTELRSERKRTHWMWFIFPQLRGLGQSSASEYYGIASLDEARAYLAHPILGPRLEECTRIVTEASAGATLRSIFGTPDDRKFHSSMTLFSLAASETSVYRRALERWFQGEPDQKMLELLRRSEQLS